MRNRSGRQDNKISLYFPAGVYTSPNFMEDFCCEFAHRLRLADWDVEHAELLFPYGDWSRGWVRQLHEMRQDMYPLRLTKQASIGGKAIADAVRSSYRGGTVLLAGHSGGGVAAVHAAEMLAAAGVVKRAHLRIVQIGSPKCAIPEELRDRTLYISSAKDPVTLISGWGSWGGLERESNGRLRWNPRKRAPLYRMHIPIIGKHADYFRSYDPYVNEKGISNLELIVQSIWTWLNDAVPVEESDR